MTRELRLRALVALALGLLVLIGGLAYAVTRDEQVQSSATLTLVPDPRTEEERSILLESFDRSGTIGTFVELIGSRDVLLEAEAGAATVDVRAVPDSRVISVSVTGSGGGVQHTLERVIETAQARSGDLGSLWRLDVLESAGPAEPAGPPTVALVIATVLLALIATVATFVLSGELLRRLDATQRGRPGSPSVVRVEGMPTGPANERTAQANGRRGRRRRRRRSTGPASPQP
jgi:hypothetical protein